ncbi:MAG: Fic family protein [Desulfovibrionaceae bacterium]|nr:Fic family protein [Desulfovibrionaceae bacterium]
MSPPVRYHLNGFPPANLDWARLVPLIGKANAALARYDGLITAMPNAAVLLSPLTMREAVLSSSIEGTNVTLSEVLEIEAGADAKVEQPKRDDAEEIVNYRKALVFAANVLQDRPFSQHVLREAHALLMQGVRGRDKAPGAFRNEQNWIGPKGCAMGNAAFVPIPQEHLLAGIERWAAYIQSADEPDPLVQLALIHVEFEALHPFKDGNGRLGRMLIPLFLYMRKLLSGPNFYMSGYLEARREEYVEALRSVSRDGAWTEWAAFFLQGVFEQALENQAKATAILDLYRQMLKDVPRLTHSQFSPLAVEFLFSKPIFSSVHFIKTAKIPKTSAPRLLAAFREAGILSVIREASGRRPAFYVFSRLMNIAEGKNVF